MCHWWHLGQDLCIGQGITSNHWGGAFTVFRNLFVSVVFSCQFLYRTYWVITVSSFFQSAMEEMTSDRKNSCPESCRVKSSFWQVKDGPDAAFPFRAFRRLRFSNGVWRGDCGDSCWFCSTEAKQDHNGAVCLMKLVNSSGAMGKYFENIFQHIFHIFHYISNIFQYKFPHFCRCKILRKLCTLPLADASAAEAQSNLRHFRPHIFA